MSKYYEDFKKGLFNHDDGILSISMLNRYFLQADDEIKQKDQRIAELECDLENLTAYDLKKSHEYSIKILMQANENLSKQIAELKTENNEFCDYNKKLREEKQTAVKEFADEFKKLCFNYGEFDDIICYRNNACELIDKILKERGIE